MSIASASETRIILLDLSKDLRPATFHRAMRVYVCHLRERRSGCKPCVSLQSQNSHPDASDRSNVRSKHLRVKADIGRAAGTTLHYHFPGPPIARYERRLLAGQ